jgi:putative redox protein
MKATVSLLQKVRFEAKDESGHTLTIDGSPDIGGENAGFRPMDLLMTSLGGCMALNVLPLLRKMRQEVTSYTVLLEGDRTQKPPRVFTEIRLEHVLKGRGLKPQAVERALAIAEEETCSASAMLAKAAKITNTYRIVEDEK